MSTKILQTFDVSYLQVLDEQGNVDQKLFPKGLNAHAIKEMYHLMVRARKLDEKMMSLQRQGRLGTFASVRGHEAVQVASVYAREKGDWIVPYFRQWAAYLASGYPMEMLLQYAGGDDRGMELPEGLNIFPMNIPVASQIPHAVGFAWGLQMQKKKSAVICYLGDGATSKGDFHEGLNFAGVFHVPVVFICENNQYAISVPRSRQSAAATLAQKAISYGFEGVQVDGNDLFGMYRATREALENARKGKPTLIEAYTYRLGDHTTSDDASKYRAQAEVDLWKKKDPVDRLRKHMEAHGSWSAKEEQLLLKQVEKEVNDAVAKMEKIKPRAPLDIFSYQYAEMTPALKEQWKDHFGGGE